MRWARRQPWPTLRQAAESLIGEIERATLPGGDLSDRATTGRKVLAAPDRRIVAGVIVARLHGGYWYDENGVRLGTSVRQARVAIQARGPASQAVA